MMGNESSVMVGEGTGSNRLQTQGQEHLWTVSLQQGSEGGEGGCVFVRKPGTGDLADLCGAAVDHLLLLRHPNIIKYLDSEISHDQLVLMTEPVVPVLRGLEETNMDTVVMGWRGLAAGLNFLHKKAGLSHNNLHVGCVYVNVVDGQWKLGGFEAAARQKDINAAFLSAISSIRHEKATPPEDKPEKAKSVALSSAPMHSRDVWGYAHFMLTILEEAGLEAQVTDSSLQYINDKMLNPDPQLRPTISDILAQPWMNNQATLIADFLNNLTLKTKADKDIFFRDLASDLHALSPSVVVEHIAPLLINPLVMAEPRARDCLWKHLLLPATPKHPQPKVFKASLPCPLLQQDLFKTHVIPLLLDLMESREYHVRLTLLDHIRHFAPLCDHDDLLGIVLPEVLVGLKDSNDKLVGATLHALGDLVPLLGADTVMGTPTPRKQVFTDAQPRTVPLSTEVEQPSIGCPKGPPSTRKNTPPPSRSPKRSREDRMREMKEKREQQRQQRMARNKLGHVTSSSNVPEEDAGTPTDTVVVAPPSNPSPQYSPSISHDEVEVEGLGGSGTSIDVTVQSSKVRGDDSDSEHERVDEGKWFGREGKEEEEWEEWSDIEELGGEEIQVPSPPHAQHVPVVEDSVPMTTPPSQSSSKLVLKSKKSLQGSSKREESKGLKGRLSTEDIQRIEEQTLRAKHEPDLFADMSPKIIASGSLHSDTTALGGQGVTNSSAVTSSVSGAFQYQPDQSQELNSGDWGDEDWNENF